MEKITVIIKQIIPTKTKMRQIKYKKYRHLNFLQKVIEIVPMTPSIPKAMNIPKITVMTVVTIVKIELTLSFINIVCSSEGSTVVCKEETWSMIEFRIKLNGEDTEFTLFIKVYV